MTMTKTEQLETKRLTSTVDTLRRYISIKTNELNKLKRVLELLVEKYKVSDDELNEIYIEASK